MARRWLLVAPSLTLGLVLAVPAAASAAPPPVDDVATVYPHLAGATAYLSPREPVAYIRADCTTGAVVRGAFSRGLSYPSADPAVDPATAATGTAPLVTATVIRFPTKARAVRYLRGARTYAERCPADPDPLVADEVGVVAFPAELRLGDARSAYTTTETVAGVTSVSHRITVRTGRVVIVSGVRSADGVAPGWRKAVAFTKLVVRSVLPARG
jgi:hypothetical protein